MRKGLLFAGTETAVWMSNDDGDHWQCLQYNLPHTSMRDLEIKGNDLIVATHGRSFWILDDISALRQLDGVNDDPTLTDSRSRESAKVGPTTVALQAGRGVSSAAQYVQRYADSAG